MNEVPNRNPDLKRFAVPQVRPARHDWWLLTFDQQDEVTHYLEGVRPWKDCSLVAAKYLERHHGASA